MKSKFQNAKEGKSSQVSGKYSSPQKNCPNQKSGLNLISEAGKCLGVKDNNQDYRAFFDSLAKKCVLCS